ncbi:MAG: hypothetical protein JXR40_09895 [Pontiellaceae bacterium]|nr:hypothetical protein [Pontiellaceae bacterium]
MKCPHCNEEFELTLGLYFSAPFGKFECPLCKAPLKGRHRLFYWPTILLAIVVTVGPVTYYCYERFGYIAGIIAGVLVGLVVVLPLDIALERKYSMPQLRGSKETDGSAL